MKSKDDPSLRCTAGLEVHTNTCDGVVPEETLAVGVVVPQHRCRARMCARHTTIVDGRDLCPRCAAREQP